jgi:hypothetical protein
VNIVNILYKYKWLLKPMLYLFIFMGLGLFEEEEVEKMI